jgi:hypothetical protein
MHFFLVYFLGGGCGEGSGGTEESEAAKSMLGSEVVLMSTGPGGGVERLVEGESGKTKGKIS